MGIIIIFFGRFCNVHDQHTHPLPKKEKKTWSVFADYFQCFFNFETIALVLSDTICN